MYILMACMLMLSRHSVILFGGIGVTTLTVGDGTMVGDGIVLTMAGDITRVHGAAGMGYAPKWFSCDGMDGILGGVDNFDVSLTEGVMLLTPFAADATDDLTQSFVTKYKEKYGETPNQFAADSYDAIYVIKAAIEKSGVTPDMSVSDICDGMKAAMTEITVDGLTGNGMTWTADGEANKAPKAVVIENGAYKAM